MSKWVKRSKTVTVEGVELQLTELLASEAAAVKALAETDEWVGSRKAFVLIVRNPDGSPFFGDEKEVDDLPTHVVEEIGKAIKALNAPKK